MCCSLPYLPCSMYPMPRKVSSSVAATNDSSPVSTVARQAHPAVPDLDLVITKTSSLAKDLPVTTPVCVFSGSHDLATSSDVAPFAWTMDTAV